MTLQLSSSRNAPYLRVRAQASGPITSAVLNGRPMDLSSYSWAQNGLLQFNYANIPETGITLSLTMDSPDTLSLLIEDSTLDLPVGLTEDRGERPSDTMPAPSSHVTRQPS